MKNIKIVFQDYQKLDNQLSLEENRARLNGFNNKLTELQRRRKFNDQSTFLFLFSRFEGEINDYSKRLIFKKTQSINASNWNRFRSWDILDHDRMSLMNKVALLARKGSSNYNLIGPYYEIRNEIAHGRFTASTIFIPTVYQDLINFLQTMNK